MKVIRSAAMALALAGSMMAAGTAAAEGRRPARDIVVSRGSHHVGDSFGHGGWGGHVGGQRPARDIIVSRGSRHGPSFGHGRWRGHDGRHRPGHDRWRGGDRFDDAGGLGYAEYDYRHSRTAYENGFFGQRGTARGGTYDYDRGYPYDFYNGWREEERAELELPPMRESWCETRRVRDDHSGGDVPVRICRN